MKAIAETTQLHVRSAAVIGLIALSGCGVLDSLVDVDAPSRIIADVLETPQNASRLLDGAVADFECAFGGYIVFMGAFSDELRWANGTEAWASLDSRNLTESGFASPQSTGTCDQPADGEVPGLYKSLSTARYQADHLLDLLAQWGIQVSNAEEIKATAAAFSGYSHLLLGESMCTAAFDLGPELEPDQIFDRAEQRFTTALASAGTNTQLQGLARIGRARTRLDRTDLAGAKSDAELVAPAFQWNAEFSTIAPRRQNQVFVRHVRSEFVTIQEPFRVLNDPRVPVANTGRLSPLGIPLWISPKYPAANSSVRLASWVEAQLILAEAELGANNTVAAVDAINRVRTRPGVGLTPFSSSDAAAIRTQLLQERMAEFFLESQRHGDVRRLDLPLDPAAGVPYPVGGGSYGAQRCVPLPLVERLNNPNIDGD